MKSEPLKKIFQLIKEISLFRTPINFRASKRAKIGLFRAPFIFAQIKCAKIKGIKVVNKVIMWLLQTIKSIKQEQYIYLVYDKTI